MGVWMQREIAGPGVEHGGDPELGAEPLGITPQSEQRARRRVEQQLVEVAPVAASEWTQRRWQRENDMETLDRQDALSWIGL